jgi:hypothetical protein
LGKPLSADLEAVLLKGLAKRPSERYGSAREFGEALAACSAAGKWTNQESNTWWVTATGSATIAAGPAAATVHQLRTLELTSASQNG